MHLRRFKTLVDAERWYQRAQNVSENSFNEMFLALCRGEDERALALYRKAVFPSRWWVEISYMQGHYLIRLRRRDRLIELAQELHIDTGLNSTTDSPSADLQSIAESIRETAAHMEVGDPLAAVMYCLLGHTYLAMDYDESANAAYRRAIEIDRSVWIPWENTSSLEFCREED
jgi:hypothetical protein